MHDEIIKKILESCKASKIEPENFHRIKKQVSGKKIAFVDGGNAQIIESSNFSLSLVRVGCVSYLGGKKIAFKKCDFFVFVNAVSRNDKLLYEASFYGAKPHLLESFAFDSLDKTLMLGMNRADISSIAGAIRRFAELRMARIISETDGFCDIITLDGSLQASITHEKDYMDELRESCSKNNVILTAISKTSPLLTDNANPLSAVLGSISNTPSWFYHPIAHISGESHKADMFLAKFHSNSKHVFRLDILNSQKEHAEEAISILSGYCTDPIFPGYPYGLIEADRISRVSNREKESLNTMFLLKLGNKNIEKRLSSSNAHSILDKISF